MVFMTCINLFPSTNQNVPLCIYTRPFHLVYQPQQHLEMKKERRKLDICHETPDFLLCISKLMQSLPTFCIDTINYHFTTTLLTYFPT